MYITIFGACWKHLMLPSHLRIYHMTLDLDSAFKKVKALGLIQILWKRCTTMSRFLNTSKHQVRLWLTSYTLNKQHWQLLAKQWVRPPGTRPPAQCSIVPSEMESSAVQSCKSWQWHWTTCSMFQWFQWLTLHHSDIITTEEAAMVHRFYVLCPHLINLIKCCWVNSGIIY